MSMFKLLIHATNIHQGGGAVLLADLLRSIPPNIRTTAVLDTRMVIPEDVPENVCIERVRPSLLRRLLAEYRLSRVAGNDDCVLCFGNLPPLFKLDGNVSVFVQNRYLVDEKPVFGDLPLKTRLRLQLERVWLRWNRDKAKNYFVQTPTMKRLTESRLGVQVTCAPFVPDSVMCLTKPLPRDSDLRFDFIYVASAESHKNHKDLVNAWGILADEGYFPSLALTIAPDTASTVLEQIAIEGASRGLQIQNLGVLSHEYLLDVYRSCKALIYPSSFESFGLPLIEARRIGLAVLAPELDYVRDITDPDETFDPCSPVSIARAVKRYIYRHESSIEPVAASIFVEQLIQGNIS